MGAGRYNFYFCNGATVTNWHCAKCNHGKEESKHPYDSFKPDLALQKI